jgi:hypothetical protein
VAVSADEQQSTLRSASCPFPGIQSSQTSPVRGKCGRGRVWHGRDWQVCCVVACMGVMFIVGLGVPGLGIVGMNVDVFWTDIVEMNVSVADMGIVSKDG